MSVRSFVTGLAALCGLVACGPLADQRPADVDLRPPLLQSVETTDPSHLRLSFDEDASIDVEETRVSPPLGVTAADANGPVIVVAMQRQTPGLPYVLEAEASDARGNSSSFLAEFYGFNGNVPRLLVNELTPRGSSTHPDLTEIAVLSDGNMGGVVLYNGTPGSFDSRLVFPSFSVCRGAFIVVHWKPAGEPGEVNETTDPALSTAPDSCSTAWDFWVVGGTGLGGNNGVLCLCNRPGGDCLDGVLYSNRTSESDARYRGFGSAEMLARAEELVRIGGWRGAGRQVAPEDAISPEGSTATRSLCRSSECTDTDTAADWHIVPTSGYSFGGPNSDEVYRP